MSAGWLRKKLGSVCDKTMNIRWQGDDSFYQYIDLSSVSRETLKIEDTSVVNRANAPSRAKKIVHYNDVIFGTTRPTLRRVALVDEAFDGQLCSTGFSVLRSKENEILPKFIYYFFQTDFFMERMELLQRGTSYPAVTDKDVKGTKIPTPALPEQKQIVAILDEAFEAIDQAKANIEKNIQNAQELFQSKLNEIFSQRGERWEEKELGKISFVKSGGTPSRAKKEYWNGGDIPWYSSGELNDLYTQEPERHITKIGLDNSNAKLFPEGSLLIGMYDTAALKMSLIDRPATFNQAIAGVEPRNNLNLVYIFHAINAKKPELLKERRGVRQKNLSLTKIKAIRLMIPALEIQNRVVEELAVFNEYVEDLVSSYQKKVSDLEELKKSILQKAFSGELTKNFSEEIKDLVTS